MWSRIVEEAIEVLGRFTSESFASREESVFIGSKRGFAVLTVAEQSAGKLRTVVHGEVGAFPRKRRHEVRGIAEQRHTRHSFPPMIDRQSIIRSKQRVDFAVCNEGGELRSPSLELICDEEQAGFCVANFEGSDPAFRLVLGHVSLHRTVGVAMCQDALAWSDCHTRTAADCVCAGFMARVTVGEERFDEASAGVNRLRGR